MKIAITIVCVLLVLTVVYLQTCTGVDFAERFNKFDAAAYRSLRQGIHSENYELAKIDEATSCVIAYDSVHKYFLVTNNTCWYKIDASGQIVYRFERLQNGSTLRSEDGFAAPLLPYLFDTTGLLDMSLDTPGRVSYTSIINADGKADFQPWFDDLYKDADVVVYGPTSDDSQRRSIYIKKHNQWTLLYGPAMDARFKEEGDFTGYRMEGYPARGQRLIMLKEAEGKRYSNLVGNTEQQLREGGEPLEELNWVYPSAAVKTLASKKKGVFSHYAYSPLPSSLRYDAAYSIPVGGEELIFWAEATKDVGAGKSLQTYLQWYRLPVPLGGETAVSFVKYGFPVMQAEDNGLFVVRRRR